MAAVDRVEFGWFIPTTGDGKHIGVKPERESTLEYMIQVAQTAEQAGFEFALIPTGNSCIDAWIVGSALAAQTRTLKPLVAMRPGLIAPVLAARMGASLDRISGGRALINVVSGGYPDDLRVTGDPLYHDHDARYDRTREFLNIVKQVWTESHDFSVEGFLRSGGRAGVHFEGEYYQIEGGVSQPAPVQKPHPPLYFGGSSPAGKRVAAETADVYLLWAETIQQIREQIEEVESYLSEQRNTKGIDRTLRYGLRAQLVVRDTEEEAWAAAREITSLAPPELLNVVDQVQAKSDAINQQRQTELWKKSQDNDYVIGPNLWAGLSRIRGGGAVAFVGTPDQVSDRLLEFVDAGISTFVLSGYPHVEEAQIAGDKLLPLFKAKWEARIGQTV